MDARTWASLVEVAFATRDPENVAALFAEDGWRIEHVGSGVQLMGREQIAHRARGWFRTMPDLRLTLTAVHGDDDVRVLEWVMSGSAADGTTPVTVPGVSVCEMNGDLIAVERNYFDASRLATASG